MEKIIKTKSLGELVIKLISKSKSRELIINNHYSKKWNHGGFGLYNFGIFRAGEESEEECLGVASFGYMKNSKAKIFSHPNPRAMMLELNRMWIDDSLGKNSESLLIAHSIKTIKKLNKNVVAIQSFADGRLGCGTIYKAYNFKFYGKHQTIFLRNKRTGEVTHQQNLTNTRCSSVYIRENIAYLMGDLVSFKVDTYRYIFPLCKHFKFIKLQQPYPEYNKGEYDFKWVRDRAKIKERLKKMIEEL